MPPKKRKTVESWKKKEWYTIVAPKEMEEKELATTPAEKPESLMNRTLKVPLREITGNMSHQFVELSLRVIEVKGKTAHTKLTGFELTREYLRRNIRRRKSMIKVIQQLRSSDGVGMQLTTYIFTARKIDSSKKSLMRAITTKSISAVVSKNEFITILEKAVFGSLAMEIGKQCKKIAPIRRVEISKCKVQG